MTLRIEAIPKNKPRCGEWHGDQCRATKDLTSCVVTVKQCNILKAPEKVVVQLCPKHFQLLIPKKADR